MIRTANLIENADATVALIANPLAWRVRVVEELVVDTATSCERRRSLQTGPLRSALTDYVAADDEQALVALPVSPMPRGPMVDFNVEGPLGDGWLLPRVEIAARQSRFLRSLVRQFGAETAEFAPLLEAIMGFTGQWVPAGDLGADKLRRYLEAGIDAELPDDLVGRWQEIADKCKAVLRPHLDRFEGYSASENPALVLPDLLDQGRADSIIEATAMMESYLSVLQDAERDAQRADSPARDYLNSLADYANNYELLVAMRVPLDEPFIVRSSERRRVVLNTLRNRGSQEVVIADAQTNHVTLKILDPNVRISNLKAYVSGSSHLAYGAFASREDAQSRAFYAHETDRDYRVRLEFTLAPLFRLQFVSGLVAALELLLIIALTIGRPHDLKSLALIAGPAALAASLLVTREPSTLGSWLRRKTTFAVSLLLTALIAVSALLYANGKR